MPARLPRWFLFFSIPKVLGHVSWYPPAAFVLTRLPTNASLASDELHASSILSFILEHWILRNVNHSLQPTVHLARQQAQAWLVLPGQVKTAWNWCCNAAFLSFLPPAISPGERIEPQIPCQWHMLLPSVCGVRKERQWNQCEAIFAIQGGPTFDGSPSVTFTALFLDGSHLQILAFHSPPRPFEDNSYRSYRLDAVDSGIWYRIAYSPKGALTKTVLAETALVCVEVASSVEAHLWRTWRLKDTCTWTQASMPASIFTGRLEGCGVIWRVEQSDGFKLHLPSTCPASGCRLVVQAEAGQVPVKWQSARDHTDQKCQKQRAH